MANGRNARVDAVLLSHPFNFITKLCKCHITNKKEIFQLFSFGLLSEHKMFTRIIIKQECLLFNAAEDCTSSLILLNVNFIRIIINIYSHMGFDI